MGDTLFLKEFRKEEFKLNIEDCKIEKLDYNV
jgi:hypothetical protein